jgi:2-phosphosulfolactate phosphatase
VTPSDRLDPAHTQAPHRVRLEWGPTGAAAVVPGADVAVVVDVLSFTTTVTVAVERGMVVHPFPWRDGRAQAYAAELGATLAVGRFEARERPGLVSLSPASLAAVEGVERLVLPSPNGSTISATLAESGAVVVAVVAAGERWPDGSLRPAAEDLWGAGAVLGGLDPDLLSPEAQLAADAYAAVADRLPEALAACASGRELVAAGFADDVVAAARLDVTGVVPRLVDGAFVTGG